MTQSTRLPFTIVVDHHYLFLFNMCQQWPSAPPLSLGCNGPTCGALHGDHSLQRQFRGWKTQWGERQPGCAEVSILGACHLGPPSSIRQVRWRMCQKKCQKICQVWSKYNQNIIYMCVCIYIYVYTHKQTRYGYTYIYIYILPVNMCQNGTWYQIHTYVYIYI